MSPAWPIRCVEATPAGTAWAATCCGAPSVCPRAGRDVRLRHVACGLPRTERQLRHHSRTEIDQVVQRDRRPKGVEHRHDQRDERADSGKATANNAT